MAAASVHGDGAGLPGFPGLNESMRSLPAARAGRARGTILILGASGFLGSWVCKAAALADELGLVPASPVFAVTDHPSPALAAAIGPGIKWLSHEQALASVWGDDALIICLFGSSRFWAARSQASKSAENHLMVNWAAKARQEGFRCALASTGACSPVDGEGMSRETRHTPAGAADAGAYGNSMSYADVRLGWEALALETRDSVIARVHSALGPGLPAPRQWACWSMAEKLAAGIPAVATDPDLLRPWLHPADIAAWLFWLSHGGTGIYNLAPKQSRSMGDLARDLTLAWRGEPVEPGAGHSHLIDTHKCQAAGLHPHWGWHDMVQGFCAHAKIVLADAPLARKP
jgi:nucleoside-diphosphate-sugar epimerase